MRSVLIISNVSGGLYLFRRELIERLTKDNAVTVLSSDTGHVDDFVNMGCRFIETKLDRHGKNPFSEWKLLSGYKNRIREIKPDVVLTYTIKPNIYGGIACASLNVPYIANVTGLGTSIENPGLLQLVSLTLYAFGLRKAEIVFFQNQKNLDFMLRHHAVHSRYMLIPGSGVNLERFRGIPYPAESETLRFLFIGRVTKDKGMDELLEAIRIVKGKYGAAVAFDLIGKTEDDRYKTEIEKLSNEGMLAYHGFQKDVTPFIKNAHALIQPSYHEGMSNVMLEAAASCRPVLGSDVPGCRETFDEGVSGFGFAPRSVESLVGAIERFIETPYQKKAEMGIAGRRKMESSFDRNIVIDRYLEVISSIKGENHGTVSTTVE